MPHPQEEGSLPISKVLQSRHPQSPLQLFTSPPSKSYTPASRSFISPQRQRRVGCHLPLSPPQRPLTNTFQLWCDGSSRSSSVEWDAGVLTGKDRPASAGAQLGVRASGVPLGLVLTSQKPAGPAPRKEQGGKVGETSDRKDGFCVPRLTG